MDDHFLQTLHHSHSSNDSSSTAQTTSDTASASSMAHLGTDTGSAHPSDLMGTLHQPSTVNHPQGQVGENSDMSFVLPPFVPVVQ
jgi:hypothetical protein